MGRHFRRCLELSGNQDLPIAADAAHQSRYSGMKAGKHSIVAAAMLATAPTLASADLIAYYFEGHVTAINDPGGTLPPSIVVGAAFHGTFSYSTDAVDTDPLPNFGTYRYDQPLTNAGLSITIGDVDFTVDPILPLFAATQNVPPGSSPDMFTLSTSIQPPIGSEDNSSIQFEFADYNSGIALSDDHLPLSLTDTNWHSRIFNLYGDGGPIAVHGEIETMYAIPEPRTSLLWLLGSSALLWRRRRSRRVLSAFR